MKKTITKYIVVVLMMSGCTSSVPNNNSSYRTIPSEGIDMNNVVVVKVDSCEYLYGKWGDGTWVTHKGNCKNHKK